jgi:hypothetical protein
VNANRTLANGAYTMTISSTASGDALLVFGLGGGGATYGTIVVTDSHGGDVYTNIVGSSTACPQNQFSSTIPCTLAYICNVPSGVTSVTFTTGTGDFNSIGTAVVEMSGVATSSCLDAGSNSAFLRYTTGTSFSSTAMTATAGDVLIGIGTANTATLPSLAVTGSWTNANAAPGGAAANFDDAAVSAMAEYQLGVSAGSYHATGTTTTVGGGSILVGFLP